MLQLEAAEGASENGLDEKAFDRLRRARELARDGLQEARRSVFALRPRALEDQKLPDAIRELLDKLTRDTPLKAEFTVYGSPRELSLAIEQVCSAWRRKHDQCATPCQCSAIHRETDVQAGCRLTGNERRWLRFRSRDGNHEALEFSGCENGRRRWAANSTSGARREREPLSPFERPSPRKSDRRAVRNGQPMSHAGTSDLTWALTRPDGFVSGNFCGPRNEKRNLASLRHELSLPRNFAKPIHPERNV